MLSIKVVSLALGIFTAITFILCVICGLLMPQGQHGRALEILLPGFQWLTFGNFCLGLLESILAGVYTGSVFVSIHNAIACRWTDPA